MPRGYDHTSENDVAWLFQKQHGFCSTPGCGAKLKLDRPRNFTIEHEWALARGGSNDLKNKSLRCKRCADRKTRGAGATTAGSDIGSISKEKRIIRTGKMAVNKPPLDQPRQKSKFKRKWPARKMGR